VWLWPHGTAWVTFGHRELDSMLDLHRSALRIRRAEPALRAALARI